MTAEPSAVWSDLTLSATTGPRCPLSIRPGVGWAWLLSEEWSMPLEVTAGTNTRLGNLHYANSRPWPTMQSICLLLERSDCQEKLAEELVCIRGAVLCAEISES